MRSSADECIWLTDSQTILKPEKLPSGAPVLTIPVALTSYTWPGVASETAHRSSTSGPPGVAINLNSLFMSLAAGPGRAQVAHGQLPEELKLVVEKHVAYIQSLDAVRTAATV